MPSFLMYYESISKRKQRGNLLNQLSDEMGISYVTLSQKLTKLRKGHNTFTKLERDKIAEVIKIDVHELFPPEPAFLNK